MIQINLLILSSSAYFFTIKMLLTSQLPTYHSIS